MEMDRDGHDHCFGLRNAGKVNVNDVIAHRAPLDGSEEGCVGDLPTEIH